MSIHFGSRARLAWGIGAAVLVLGFSFGRSLITSAEQAKAEQAKAAPPTLQVMVMSVKRVEMAPKLALPGTVVARNDSHLASEVEGRVAWVAEVGDVAKAGDVVARIDPDVAAMQMASDKANVARLEASLRFDRDQAARMEKLYASNAIAKATRDQAIAQRDMTAAELTQARAALDKSAYHLERSQIRAPFSGRVAERLIHIGEYATPGKDIVRLVDTGSIEVKTQAPIDAAPSLQDGMKIPVVVQNRTIDGTVRAVVPVGDELSRTIEVRLTLRPGSALVGDATNVLVPSAAPRQVIAVPRDALVLREDNTYVYKISRKNVAERVAVQTGAEKGDLVEVRGKIAVGERVVIRGAERLEAGQKVHAVAAG